MKQYFTLLILLISFKSNFAQDSIMKTNGRVIAAKIMEISPTEIKYKKWEFQDGPTYIESKSGISYLRFSNGLKEEFAPAANAGPVVINPSSPPPTEANADYYDPNPNRSAGGNAVSKMRPIGSKYIYQERKIGEREMQTILMKTQNKDIVRHIQTAKDSHKLQYIGFAAIPLGIGAIAALASSVNYNGSLNEGYLAASGVMLVAAIACPIASGIFKHRRTTNNRQAVQLYNEKY
jgi:hypothetical protein